MHILIRLACIAGAALGLSACAPMLAMVGSNTALVQVVAQVERVKLAADGASYLQSDKTLSDHALSKLTGKECKVFNILTKESVCADKTPVVAPDSDTQPKAVATGEAPAEPNPQAEIERQNVAIPARSIDVTNNQASGD